MSAPGTLSANAFGLSVVVCPYESDFLAIGAADGGGEHRQRAGAGLDRHHPGAGRGLELVADDQSKTYGQDNPVLTFSVVGLYWIS